MLSTIRLTRRGVTSSLLIINIFYKQNEQLEKTTTPHENEGLPPFCTRETSSATVKWRWLDPRRIGVREVAATFVITAE